MNYLGKSDRRQQLDSLLSSYNLGGVNFTTQTDKTSKTVIDNIYIHITKNYTINPVINGLSNHDAQLITIYDIMLSGSVCS
jgi:hypothetical protein